MNLYNEIDPFAAGWIERLVEAGHLPPGRVDRRSIVDLRGADLDATQVHLFAGIGGWPLALDLAGWPRDLLLAAPWATPTATEPGGTVAGFLDRKRRAKAKGSTLGISLTSLSLQASLALRGAMESGSRAPMGERVSLDPAHSRWLMGYPPAWDACVATETRSSRRSPRSSSARC